ncbi:MAG: class I SAM-dependent methyltransferase [Gammaproteobacteria bacterium]|nr:class I SAM-dependent methyltransferase [Gammaproteobacteria bacterium]
MSTRSFLLPERLAQYYAQVAVREPPLLAELRAETARLPMARMQIAPEQGQLMAMLVRLMGARRCVEVGVFTGYSSLAVALALPADGYLLACDVAEDWTAVARRYWARAGVAHRIELRLAPALDTLDAELRAGRAGGYDFAFIDADKGNYEGYYERCLQLLRAGGLIAVDNTLWSGRVADPAAGDEDTAAIRQFNERVAADPRVDLCLVPIADGLTLLRKRE